MRAIPALGQNFLNNPTTIKKVVALATSENPTTMLEVGPGTGALTFPLAEKIKHLHCVEKDSFLSSELDKTISHAENCNITIHTEDILSFDLDRISPSPFHIVGSLPFNISKKIISKILLYSFKKAPVFYAIVQKEVAEAYTNSPPQAHFLYHFSSIYSDPTLEFIIPRSHFSPVPDVDAACVTFRKKKPPANHEELATFTQNLYRYPRKTLKNNLNPLLSQRHIEQIHHFEKVVDLSKRPEALTHEEIKDVFYVYNSLVNET